MNKIFKLLALCGVLWAFLPRLSAQVITIKTNKAVGEKIELLINAEGEVTVEGIKEKEIKLSKDIWYGSTSEYTLSSQTLSIRGKVLGLNIPKAKISSLDLSQAADLTVLRCEYNELTSLDVSACPKLEMLNCSSNPIPQLNVSQNKELRELLCAYGKKLESLDVSHNPKLSFLRFSENQVKSIDLSHNPELWYLDCGRNKLTSIDVSTCPKLKSLEFDFNEVSELNVRENPLLEDLSFYHNKISSLDISQNPKLKKLTCRDNKLRTLDLSNNPKLTQVLCNYNELTSLNVSKNTELKHFVCDHNLLTSIDVSACKKLNLFNCSVNLLDEQAMEQTIASLHSEAVKDKRFFPIHNRYRANVCTPELVAKAKAKGWAVLGPHGKDFEGDDWTFVDPRENYIILKTTKPIGSTIELAIDGMEDARIEGVKEPIQISDDLYEGSKYTLTSQTVIIRGRVLSLNCTDAELIDLDVSHSKQLIALLCMGNQLKRLDIKANSMLYILLCGGNSFNDKAMDEIVEGLNSYEFARQKKVFVPIYTKARGNVCTAEQVAKAKERGWKSVWNEMGEAFNGDEWKYPEQTDLQELSKSFTYYPNPTKDFVCLDGLPAKALVELFSISGERILQSEASEEGCLLLDLRQYPKGLYILRAGNKTIKLQLQ